MKAKPKDKVTREALQTFIAEIESVAHSPRFQIIVTHGVLELLINALVERKCKHGSEIVNDHRTYPHGAKLVLLHEMKLLSTGHFNLLRAFKNIRNAAAHGGQFVLTNEMIEPFRLGQSEPGFDTATNAHVLKNTCYNLVVGLWNQDKDFYYPYFREMTISEFGDKIIDEMDDNYIRKANKLKQRLQTKHSSVNVTK